MTFNIDQELDRFKKKHYEYVFDLTEERDAWGEPIFKHKMVHAIWCGWRERSFKSPHVEDASEIAATLATVLHFIPKREEPELYADVERLCSQFGSMK